MQESLFPVLLKVLQDKYYLFGMFIFKKIIKNICERKGNMNRKTKKIKLRNRKKYHV